MDKATLDILIATLMLFGIIFLMCQIIYSIIKKGV